MPVRSGAEYLATLRREPREVWLRGALVEDVVAHPAFAGPAAELAKLYDLQCTGPDADKLTYRLPHSGARTAVSFLQTADTADLRARRTGFELTARATFGMMGRSPDFLNCTLAALADAEPFFAKVGRRFAENIIRYYEHVRDRDLFLTHALTLPQSDRSRASAEQASEYLHLGIVRETADGLIVRGARMLATLGPLADEVLVYNLPGLKPGDEKHALAFALPVATPGIRQIAREPFDEGTRNPFDHPLAAHFEESDTLIIFNDVLVPWDRVFMYGNVALANAMYAETAIRQHTAHQTAARGLVKLELAVGVAMTVAEAIRADSFLHVQDLLGECVTYIELVKSCILRSEVECETTPTGRVRPRLEPLQAVRILLSRAYPRVIEILQTIGAGGLLMMPSAADFDSPIRADVETYYRGAGAWGAEERTRLFKLAWDLAGDAFGMRQLQYERYYAGDPVRIRAMTYASYDRSHCRALVDRAMDLGRSGAAGRTQARQASASAAASATKAAGPS